MDLTRKVGPLPMWGWGAGLLGAAIAYSFVTRGRSSSSSDSSDSSSSTDTDTVPADQVPSYINQTYVTTNTTVQDDDDTAAPGAPSPPAHPPVNPPKTIKPALPVPIKKPPKVPPKTAKTKTYTVKHGDTLSSIAKRNGTTWQALWRFNTTAGNRPADAIKTLKQRGPNLLFSGETILIPAK